MEELVKKDMLKIYKPRGKSHFVTPGFKEAYGLLMMWCKNKLEKSIVIGLGPFERRQAPSHNPLPRNLQLLVLAQSSAPFVATDQLNYTIVM